MNTLTDRLRSLQEQVSRLVREHKALHKKAADLEVDAQDHHRLVAILKARVSELERENEVLRNAKPAISGPATPGTKEQIDDLVNEIDRCLALINA